LIYSRFDIVWPEPQSGGSEGKSVDALTYGLSTLCLGSSFAHTIHKSHGKYYNSSGLTKLTDNNYAKYCRKFSLGNGPPEWVSDYHISKESGRMLGILVAMAIWKMKNLETFIWDMPTGVLSEVFMALASLGGPSGKETSLNRVWVRWHDNSDIYGNGEYDPNEEATTTALVPPGSQLTPVGILVPPEADLPVRLEPIKYSEYRCEYPTFSCLPPLKSLTVLDIDEIGYLDEMATLIETSKDTLQELRVGIALRAVGRDFAQTWDGPNLKQVDHEARWPGESRIGERRLGGVLGVLVGKIYDIRKHRQRKKPATGPAPTINGTTVPASTTLAAHTLSTDDNEDKENDVPASAEIATSLPNGDLLAKPRSSEATSSKPCPERKLLDGKLKLHTLELERVALSLQVCRHAFDWSVLTSLTLLGCAQHDSLWKMLRKQFQPTPVNVDLNGQPSRSNGPLQYHLALKHIHTDTTTLSLINFIRDTLAPNTLEVLFLQDRRRATHPVDIDIIFKGAIKKHYASLKKLLLDCSALPNQTAATDSSSIRWRRWIPSTEMVRYITSGRMANLRELAICLDYRDWVSPKINYRACRSSTNIDLSISFCRGYPTFPSYARCTFLKLMSILISSRIAVALSLRSWPSKFSISLPFVPRLASAMLALRTSASRSSNIVTTAVGREKARVARMVFLVITLHQSPWARTEALLQAQISPVHPRLSSTTQTTTTQTIC